ncbi:signal peptide peptidase SppA [Sorangium sp. So ce1036]|uniref:signal peptide peptidase SppA n=1 Tax=Sorangium sp. So ce1036 TaxID=3133328 RepID=UPI003F08DC77
MPRSEILARSLRGCLVLVGGATSLVLVAVVIAILVRARRTPGVPDVTLLELPLDRPVVERRDPSPLPRLLGREPLTVRGLVEALDRARDDERVAGVVAYLGGADHGMAVTQELRDAVIHFRESGKPAIAFADTFGEAGPGNQAYYLATAFDEIWLQPSGDLGLTGLIAEVPFVKETLDLLDVQIRGDRREEYKTAYDTFTEVELTEAHREATTALLGDLFQQMVDAIAARRQIAPDDVRQLVDRGPFLAQAALDEGLVDRLGYRDEAIAYLRSRAGEDADLLFVDAYLSRAGPRATPARERGARFALIHGIGPVHRDPPAPLDLLGQEDRISAREVRAALRAAAADPDIKAILFRVDSPGGSYVASDTIWRAVTAARDAGKPVIVTMGNVAASGGYFVAMSATKIVAQPGTITGSIGVVRIKLLLRDLWRKVGVTWDGVATSDNAGIWSPLHDYEEDEWQHVQAWLDRAYADFTAKAARGRALSAEEVERAAKGRIWSGARARELGLVDELGGYARALELAREAAGLAPGAAVEVVEYPPRRDWLERLLAEPPESSESPPVAAIDPSRATLEEELLLRLGEVLEAAGLPVPSGALSMPPLRVGP